MLLIGVQRHQVNELSDFGVAQQEEPSLSNNQLRNVTILVVPNAISGA